ncbi:prenyltransferase/squalene oxidase repeat-containing protein [Engelhardtia mirabilis]|uniref:Squalene cyclase C-terminal domain-containing protein n=1 Tax=Engelhardtia mirabilis TaxID=2528011 RepID=A0A518BRN7_9BACT|nr:hypothetical protein Pla133_47360 [Planctomycetes bacterium Pla133]QDV03942.1 hypothetical protein Pla86_47340 [Planctomycetes bacterium Pla86]
MVQRSTRGVDAMGASSIRAYEPEDSFHDVLYDWMERAPWLAISFAMHLVLYFMLAAIPWSAMQSQEVPILNARIDPPDEVFVEPEVEEIIEKIPVPIEDPVQVVENVSDVDAISEDPAESDDPFEAPFAPSNNNNAVIGIGPGGGLGGGGAVGRPGRRPQTPGPVLTSIALGLEWLAEHQSPDGHWDGDDFAYQCDRGGPPADGEGSPLHDVGLTGLAVLAFMGWGDTPESGDYADNIRRGLAWLRRSQDTDSGRIGVAVSSNSIYDHAIATLALCEAQAMAPAPMRGRAAQSAIDFAQRARSAYTGWRYQYPPDGTADTSVTGWMVLALSAARKAGLATDPAAFRDALGWIDEVTDPATGRTGYMQPGEGVARPKHLIDVYPAELSEAMTAAGLLTRAFASDALDQPLAATDHSREAIDRGVELLLALPPHWTEDGAGVDLYYWYYASYALFQLGGSHPSAWKRWEKALVDTLLPAQRQSPACFEGSFDPIGPWGEDGGRVYATAISVLSLEVFFRYERLDEH